MKYYQHHIGDFIRDTARLSDSQCMAYLRMIWLYYDTEKPLPCDSDAIAFKIGANASDVQRILETFFFFDADRAVWHHARCDKEILAFYQKSEKAKKSANARWENANAMRTHTERNANEPKNDATQDPRPNNPLPNTSNAYALEGEAPAKKTRPGKKVEMPDDFYPNETGIRYAHDRRISIDDELPKMRNWVDQNRVLRVDWQATWRTWCDKAVEFGRAGNGKAAIRRPTRDDERAFTNASLTGRIPAGTTIEQFIAGDHAKPGSLDIITGEAKRVA